MPQNPKQQSLRKQKRPDGRIEYVVGSTGSGKTTYVRQAVSRDETLLVWDGKAEWGSSWRCNVITSPRELAAHVIPSAPPSRISYRVPVTPANFAAFCTLAWVWCRSRIGALVVEELADVTTASKAPVGWGEIVRKSRAYGTRVYALTQRPQEVDKTVQGNAVIFHCGRMSDAMDAAYIARRLLGVPSSRVEALKPLEFLARDVRSGVVRAGKINPKLRN